MELAKAAWEVRNHARILGKTRVGCAALSASGRTWAGCNVEHQFRSHDIHAEVNAISSMVAGGDLKLAALVIAADRDYFSPCGACMDWVFEFGGPECLVAWQGFADGPMKELRASDLMPHYPR